MGMWNRLTGWMGKPEKNAKDPRPVAPPVTDKSLALEEFDRVVLDGPVSFEWQPGAAAGVATMSEQDLAAGFLTVKAEGATLFLTMATGSGQAKVSARSKALSSLDCLGVSQARARGVDAEIFEARLCDGKELWVEGKAIAGRLSLWGSGELEAGMLECHALVAKVAGSGSMFARATGSAEVSISGGGDAQVWGDPPTSTIRREGAGRARVGNGRGGADEEPQGPDGQSGIFGQMSLPKS